MSLEDDDKLILRDDQTLRAAGVGKSLSLFIELHALLWEYWILKYNFGYVRYSRYYLYDGVSHA